jgi:hypothetical protein
MLKVAAGCLSGAAESREFLLRLIGRRSGGCLFPPCEGGGRGGGQRSISHGYVKRGWYRDISYGITSVNG